MLTTASLRGDFPSLKLGRMVRYSSSIERDLLYFLEYWQTVTWYCEQPMCIKYRMENGEVHRYTPDYEIHEGEFKILAECKPEVRLDTEHSQQQREIGKAWSAENGYSFRTFTETELRAGQALENIKVWWRYARLRNLSAKREVLEVVKEEVTSSIDQISLCLRLAPVVVTPLVSYLLFHQNLQTHIAEKFSNSSALWIAER